MTEDELKAIEARVERLFPYPEPWAEWNPTEGRAVVDNNGAGIAFHVPKCVQDLLISAPADLRALLLEVRRVSPIVAAALSLYDRQMYGNLPIITEQSPLFVACRKAREGQP